MLMRIRNRIEMEEGETKEIEGIMSRVIMIKRERWRIVE